MTLKQLCSAIAATTVAASAFSAPLSIEKQGTFAVGGTVKTSAAHTTRALPSRKAKRPTTLWMYSTLPFKAAGKPCTATTPPCTTKSP